jgi:hypothetical protein
MWKPRRGQAQNKVEGWPRRIRLRVGCSDRALVVDTHCAVGRFPDPDYLGLKRVFPSLLASHFEVNNETIHGLSEPRKAVAAEVAALPQVGQLLCWLKCPVEGSARPHRHERPVGDQIHQELWWPCARLLGRVPAACAPRRPVPPSRCRMHGPVTEVLRVPDLPTREGILALAG